MATATLTLTALRIGPADHGRRLKLDEFIEAEFEEGWVYELARGVVEVTEVPGPWHGRIVDRLARMFIHYDEQHPGRINYQRPEIRLETRRFLGRRLEFLAVCRVVVNYRAGGGECRKRLPGMVSDRHPDLAIYLDPEPSGHKVWTKWVPHIVDEVVSPGGEQRDFVDKHEEYLRVGVREYWILDTEHRRMHALVREGDTREETIVPESGIYHTVFLPGLQVRPAELLGPASVLRGFAGSDLIIS